MESSCPNPPTPLSCGICGISFSTSEEEIEHGYSLTHHIKLDQHFNGRVRHHCHICNVYVQGINNYTFHLGGRKHLQLLKEKSIQKQKKGKIETNKIKNKGKKISKTGDDTLKIKSAENVTATKTVKKSKKEYILKKKQKGKSYNKKNKAIVNESNITKQSSLESCSLKPSATEENSVTDSSAVECKNIIDLPVTSALSNCIQEECPDTMENRTWNSMLPNKYYETYSEGYSDMNGSSFAHNSLEWYHSDSVAYHSDPYLDRPYDYYSTFRGKNSSSRYWENPHFSHPESNYLPQKRWHKERNSSFHSGGNVGYRYKNYNENVSSTAKFNQKENGQKGHYGKVGDKSYTQQLRNDWQDEIIEDSNTDIRKSSESCVESFISSMRLANEKSNIKQCKFFIDKNSDLKKSCQSNENKTCEFPKITRDDKTAKPVSSNDVKFNSEMGRTLRKSTEKCGDTRYSDSRKKRSLLNHKGKIPKISIDLSKSRRHGGSKGSVTEYKVKQKNANVIVKNKISALTSKKSSIKERLRSGTISSQKRDISKFALKSKENNSCESNDDGITFCGRNLSNINVTLNSDSRTVQVNEQLMQESESSDAFPVKDVINNVAQDSQNVNIPKEIPDCKINVKSEEKIATSGTEEILKGKEYAKEKSKNIKGHLTNVALQRVNARLQSLTKYGKMPSSTKIRHMFFLSSDSDDDPDPKKVCQRNEVSKLLINNSGISTSSSDEQESKSEGRLQKWSKIIEQSKHDMSAYSKELVNRLVNYPRSRKEQLKLEKWIQEHARTKKKLTFPRFNMLLSNSETCKDSLVDEDYAMKNMVSEVVDSLPDDVITSLVNVLNSDFETQNLSISKETLPDDSNSKIDEIGKAICWREYSGSFETHCSSSKDGDILIQEKTGSLQKNSEVGGSVQGVSSDLQLENEAYQCPDKKCHSEDESEKKRNLEAENATCQLGMDDSLIFRSPTTVGGSKKRRKSVSAVTEEMCKETSSNFQDFNITPVPIKQEPIDISEVIDSSVSDMLSKVSSSVVQKASVSSNKTSEIDVHNLTETSSHSSRLCPNDELSQNKSANNFSNILELFANGAIQIKSEIMDPILEDIRKIDLTPLVQASSTKETICNPEIQPVQSVEEQLPSEPSNEVSATDDEEVVLQSTLYGHLPVSSSDLPEDKTKTSEVSSSTDREMVETSMPEVLEAFSNTIKQDASYCPKPSAKTSLSPGPQDMVTELLAISKREEELQSQAYRTEQMISQLSAWLEDWKKTKCEIQQEEAKLRLKRMKLLQTLHGSFQQDCIYENFGDLALSKARKESLTNQKSTVQIKSVKDVSNFVTLKCNEISEIGKTYSSVGKDENLQMVSKLQNFSGTGIPSARIGDEADQCILQCSTNELEKLEKSQMPNGNSVAVVPANSSEMCTFRLPFKNRKSKWPATQNFEHPVSPDSSSSEPDANISFEINNTHTENMEDGAEPFVVIEPICVIEEDIQSSQEKCDEVQRDLDQNICRAEQSREQLSPDNVSSEMACYQRTSVDEEVGSHSMMWPRSYLQHNVDDINIRELVAHASAIIDIKVCGGYLYTCSSDTTAKRFHLEDPTNTVVYCDHGKTVTALYVTTIAVGTCLFTSCHDGYLRCFKAKSGECLNKINMKSPIICMCEGWGKLFLGLHTGQVVLYSLMMGKQLDSLQCASTAVSRIATATQGAQRLLCIAAYDGVVTIWDASTRLLLRCLEGRVKPPCCIQISGNTVYITTTEKAVLIHELLSGKLERMLNWPSSATGLDILENHILSCSFDGLVRCYDKKGWTLHSMYYGAGKAMVMCMTVYRGWVFTGNRRGTVEAFKFDANHVEACQFGRCYFRFGRQEDLQHHVVIDHFPCLNKKVKSCPWRGCTIVFSHKNSDKEKQDHVLQHVPLDICST